MKLIRRLHALTWAVTLLLGLYTITWLSFSTANFLRIIEYSYNAETGTFTLQRKVDWPVDIRARWKTEAFGNGLDCSEAGDSVYEKFEHDRLGNPIIGADGLPKEKIKVIIHPSERLEACLTDPNVSLITTWSMKVIGPLYLRSTVRYIPPRS